MSVSELKTFREALLAVGRGAAPPASFGIERQTLSGGWWQDRLSLEGTGRCALHSLRSFGEASGEEIGRWEATLSTDRLPRLLRAIETCLPEGAPLHLEPSDLRILIRVVADGASFERVAGGPPPRMEPYLDLMSLLDQCAREVREHPRATLATTFRLLAPPRAGTQEARLEVSFRNRGSDGYWVRNPLAEFGDADEDAEHLRLWVARLEPDEPGVTPLPPESTGATLYPAEESDRPLLWIAPGETQALAFVTRLDLDPGRTLMRVGFSTYEGEDQVGGHVRIRGCVYSPEQTFEIEERV